MDIDWDSISSVLEALGKLAWPLLTALALFKLFPAIKKVLESRGFKVKVAGMEITVQEASDQLSRQVIDLQGQVESLKSILESNAPGVGHQITSAPAKSSEERLLPVPRRILWVDDNPAGNAYEAATLRGEGIEVVQARTTAEAMRIAVTDRISIGAVVTDMGRREDGRYVAKAGLQLIAELRSAKQAVPIFVYSSAKRAEQNRADVEQVGGDGITSSPVDLFELIHKAIPPLA